MVWYFDFPFSLLDRLHNVRKMTVEIGAGLFRWWRSGIVASTFCHKIKGQLRTTAPILHWVTYCMCCCWSRIFIKAQSVPLWTPWLIGWWVHCLIIALSPQDFLSKYYRRKSGHFTPWGSHIAVLQRGEKEISFLARKGIEPWSPFKKTPQTCRVTPLNTRIHTSSHTLQL